MKYIDPTGYFFKKIKKAFKKVVNTVKKYATTIVTIAVSVAVAIYAPQLIPALSGGGLFSAMGIGALAGAAGGIVGSKLNGGSWGDALRSGFKGAIVGAVSAGAAYGVAEGASSLFNVSSKVAHSSSLLNGTGGYTLATFKALAHGITRAGIAKAQGHKTSSAFWSGFASSAFAATKSMGKWGGTALTAIVSGTVSQATGGKFANGAVTGTFVHLFNSLAEQWSESNTEQHNAEVLGMEKTLPTHTRAKIDTWKCENNFLCSVAKGAWEGFGDLRTYGDFGDAYLNQTDIFKRAGGIMGIGYGSIKGAYEYNKRREERIK